MLLFDIIYAILTDGNGSFWRILFYLVAIVFLFNCLVRTGIFQILTLASIQRNTTVALFFYLFPILILITGIIILINPFDSMNTVLIVFGIAAIVYGVIDIINYFKFR